jgi:SAM-dependent methyltransferase
VDRWLVHGAPAQVLRAAADPLVVDVGFGSSPVTLVELATRLRALRPDVRVVGVEIDRDRVALARAAGLPPGVEVVHGGFELPLAGRPVLVRAMNVLRQYDEAAVPAAWADLTGRLHPSGRLVEGTCDEVGRLGCWISVSGEGRPESLTLSARLASLERPGSFAERLPKVLIAHNIDGEPVHAFLRALDAGWDAEAARAVFGPRQRFVATAARLRADGWPLLDGAARWRLGEVSVAWPGVAPVRAATDRSGP